MCVSAQAEIGAAGCVRQRCSRGSCPPRTFRRHEAGAPSPPADSALGLLLGALPGGSLSGAVGRILGGVAAEERWQHLAGDAAACEAIKTSVALHHIICKVEMIEDTRERARAANQFYGGRLCTPSGSKALLVHGTPRWDVCVRFAQHLAQRDGEDDASYASRCRRGDAWARASAFEKAGITLLVLWQAAVFVSGVDLFEGVAPHRLGIVSSEALSAHLRVPSRLRPQTALERLFDSGWRLPAAGAFYAGASDAARREARTTAGDGASDSTRSTVVLDKG